MAHGDHGRNANMGSGELKKTRNGGGKRNLTATQKGDY
ncbi:hypothetical protein BH20BAC1_BH20BAC1_17580 [soil metagenome]